jgi:hypothetical protein
MRQEDSTENQYYRTISFLPFPGGTIDREAERINVLSKCHEKNHT